MSNLKKLSSRGFEDEQGIALYMVISAIFGGASHIARQIAYCHENKLDENGRIPMPDDESIVADGYEQATALFEAMGFDIPSE